MADSTLLATIAQVLPLFVLALAAERRLGVHARSTDPTGDAILGISVIASAAIGEFAALAGLAGTPTHGERVAAELSAGIAGLLLVADLIWQQVAEHRAHDVAQWRQRLVLALGAVVVGSGTLLLIVGGLAAWLS